MEIPKKGKYAFNSDYKFRVIDANNNTLVYSFKTGDIVEITKVQSRNKSNDYFIGIVPFVDNEKGRINMVVLDKVVESTPVTKEFEVVNISQPNSKSYKVSVSEEDNWIIPVIILGSVIAIASMVYYIKKGSL